MVGEGKPIKVSYTLSGPRSYCYVAPSDTTVFGAIVDSAGSGNIFDALGTVLRQVEEGDSVPWAGLTVSYTVISASGGQILGGEEKTTNSGGKYVISGLSEGDTVLVQAAPYAATLRRYLSGW